MDNNQMFEKENPVDEFSSVNLDNYAEEPAQPTGTFVCNPIAVFIGAAFLLILLAVIALVSAYQANTATLLLTRHNLTLTHIPTHFAATDGHSVSLYLSIPALTQFDKNNQLTSPAHGELAFLNGECPQYRTNQQLKKTTSINGTPLDPLAIALPCGYFPGMFPVGTIRATLSNGTTLPIETTSLTNFDYNSQNLSPSLQWADVTDPIFQSWMQPNAKMSTTKLIGRLTASFQGLVTISITMPNDTPINIDQASLILQSNRPFGHKNISFCVISFIQSGILFLFAISLFQYGRIIKKEVEQSKSTSHTLEIRSERDQVHPNKP